MHPDTLKFYKYTPIKKPQFQGKFCKIPFNIVQIDKDGDVQLCDCQLHMPYTIGNIFKNSLQEIWANHEAAQVRQSVADGDFTYCSWACPKLQNLKSRPDKLPQVHNFPKVIKLDLDLSCNLKCSSCREHVIIEKNSEKIQKQIELFEEIRQWALNHPSKSFTIIPGASGEIFASHSGLKFLESLVNYPHHNLKIQITSNGTLITKNLKTLEKIHHLLNRVEVSIDAATAATYTTVRGGDWSALISGLDFFHGIKKPLVFKYVVQKNNWHEIVDFAELAHQYNASVYYSNLLDWGHWTIKWWHDNNVLDRHNEHYHSVLTSLQQVKKRYPRKMSFSADILRNLKKIEHN
jgi:radical SAM protein with 4Fe4S-binding SPASM domain